MKKFRCSLLLVVVLALCAGVFAACDGEKVTVTLDANGGTCAVQTVTGQIGKKLAPVPSAERDGYVFEGWFTSASGGERWDFETDKVKGSMTLYAGFRTRASDFVGVTYFVGEGAESAPESRDVRIGNLLPRPSDPIKSGYRFDGWFKDEACTIAWDFAADAVQSELILYAKWTKMHTVTVMRGQEHIASVVYEEGGTLKNSLPALEGLVYTGLYEDAEFTAEVGANSVVEQDVTYYARYEKPTSQEYFDYDSEYGRVTINGLKEEFEGEEVIVPEYIEGLPVKTVYIYREKGFKRVVISSNVEIFDTNLKTEKLVVSPANANFRSYDDCIYVKNYGSEVRFNLISIPDNKRLVNVMPGAYIGSVSGREKVFMLSDDAYAHEYDSFDSKRIVVLDEYYDGYLNLVSDSENYLFRKSEITDEALVKNGKLYMWIGGGGASVGTDADGITEIMSGALYGVHEVTFGENINVINGRLFSEWPSRNEKADEYKYTFLGEVPQRTETYAFFPSVFKDEGDVLEIKVKKEFVVAYKEAWNMNYGEFTLVGGETSLAEDGKLIAWFGGDTAVVGTETDGITIIGDGALYGVHDITVGANIEGIEGYWCGGYSYDDVENVSITFLGKLPVMEAPSCPVNERNGSTFVVTIPEQFVKDYSDKFYNIWEHVKIATENEFTVIDGTLYKYNGKDKEIHLPADIFDVRSYALPSDITKLYFARPTSGTGFGTINIYIYGLRLKSDKLDVYIPNGYFAAGDGTREVYARFYVNNVRFYSFDSDNFEIDKRGTVTYHVDTADATALEHYTDYGQGASEDYEYTEYYATAWEVDANA